GGGDHPDRVVGGGTAASGGSDAECEGGAADAGDRAGAGRPAAGRGGGPVRHGPSDAARLGAPLQRRRGRGPFRPAGPPRPEAVPVAGAGGGGGTVGRSGTGAGRARRLGALAPRRPAGPHRAAFRSAAARAHGGQAAAAAALPAPVRASAAPRQRPGGAGGVQKNFAALL
ncbi:MAG: Mobile element protein, partial [uncultured Acetobacteraceae bacterium]